MGGNQLVDVDQLLNALHRTLELVIAFPQVAPKTTDKASYNRQLPHHQHKCKGLNYIRRAGQNLWSVDQKAQVEQGVKRKKSEADP
ncbi:hypothetical protein [Marinobacter changyiensis]|uniref:hypothetical protein n=1 Tax=Marinobacter changyiensis TaxID=2604091 RepID=UPI001265838A|nr:hypothetical protein [Marinobacter changyiensis]